MIKLLDVDLLAPIQTLPTAPGEAWITAWAGDQILGETRVSGFEPVERELMMMALALKYRSELFGLRTVRPRREDPHIAPGDVTVVVCTKDRASYLDGCLLSLGALDPPPGEILVVDNASSDDSTQTVAARHGVRVISAPVAGLNRARNRGWSEATRPVVLFVDDDARAHSSLIAAAARGFTSDRVGAVTGLVLPAELLTYPQLAFERLENGMRKGFQRKLFDARAHPVGLEAFRLGVGTNMAFRLTTLRQIGGFMEDIGVGTPIRGGGDLEALYQTIMQGFVVAYEPSAVVRHIHRRTRAGLLAQMRDYGISFNAFLDRRASESRTMRREVGRYRRKWHYERHFKRSLNAIVRGELLEAQMAVAEWRGSLEARARRTT